MPYELNANLGLEYVHLIYSGEVELTERLKAKDAVFSLCFEKNLHRALVDVSGSSMRMHDSDIIKFASSFKDTKLPLNYRLACVVGPNNESDKLIEIIISLDGINVKYFNNFKEAESWLIAV